MCLLIFIKTSKITDQKDFYKKKRFSQTVINKNKCAQILDRWADRGTRQ